MRGDNPDEWYISDYNIWMTRGETGVSNFEFFAIGNAYWQWFQHWVDVGYVPRATFTSVWTDDDAPGGRVEAHGAFGPAPPQHLAVAGGTNHGDVMEVAKGEPRLNITESTSDRLRRRLSNPKRNSTATIGATALNATGPPPPDPFVPHASDEEFREKLFDFRDDHVANDDWQIAVTNCWFKYFLQVSSR